MQNNAAWLIASALLAVYLCFCSADLLTSTEHSTISTDLANEPDSRLLLLSTLEGTLVAIQQYTGQILWKISDRPTVTVPIDTTDAIFPLFLPDPRDGSLYLVGNDDQPLKKLPFTVPKLVANSPCRSSDGILYTGKKKDFFFKLDPKTGERQLMPGWDTSPTCPIPNENAVYIGRTQYTLLMVDSRNTQRKWNVTYYDYSANPLTKDMAQNYEWIHFTSTSTGRIITMDRSRGVLMWDHDFGSPIVSIYMLDSDGLLNIPFTSMANHTLEYLASNQLVDQKPFQNQPSFMKLYPTLYIGQHLYGLYALPSLVDQNLVTITASDNGPLLLQGPDAPSYSTSYSKYPIPGYNYHVLQGMTCLGALSPKLLGAKDDSLTFQSVLPELKNFIHIGHYNVPDYYHLNRVQGPNIFERKLITDQSSTDQNSKEVKTDDNKMKSKTIKFEKPETKTKEIQTDPDEDEKQLSFSAVKGSIVNNYKLFKLWINQRENKGLEFAIIVLCGLIIFMYCYFQMQVNNIQHSQRNSSQPHSNGRITPNASFTEELSDGMVKIGKIMFDPENILGRGCEGTYVFSGEFDKRKVAVKRLLPNCFSIADREVALLRESDTHPNVIRYFCTEQDRMFKYIALELCNATLQDYVNQQCDKAILDSLSPLEILKQATAGLEYLHSLTIVHRDVKPHNVLISTQGNMRVMISDFGLCKKLQVGHTSLSRRSGISGTEGWIAPEMVDGRGRITCAVDMFSLGCLFYYVLSKGKHPFGEGLHRQGNILENKRTLKDLKGEAWEVATQKTLVTALISQNQSDRPTCSQVLSHPMFWRNSRILGFFQDVSDRVEKVELDDEVLKTLERGAEYVVRRNWAAYLDREVSSDLRKYRSYRTESLRDLLRALRNKKHHYRELTQEARNLLGDIPDAFTTYWTSKFPLLLIHSFLTMQIVANEKPFDNYYSTHRFSLANYADPNDILYEIAIEHFNEIEPNLDEQFPIAPYINNNKKKKYYGDRNKKRAKKEEQTYQWRSPPNV